MSQPGETAMAEEVGDEQAVKITEPSQMHENTAVKEEGDEQGAGDGEMAKVNEDVTEFLEAIIESVVLIVEKKCELLKNSLPSGDAENNQSESADDETGDYKEAQDTMLGDIPIELFEKNIVVDQEVQKPKKKWFGWCRCSGEKNTNNIERKKRNFLKRVFLCCFPSAAQGEE